MAHGSSTPTGIRARLAITLLAAALAATTAARADTAVGATDAVPGERPLTAVSQLGLADSEGRVRVQLAARNEVVLSSELSATIASLPLREGDVFRSGQTLVSFDCALYQAQLDKSQAALLAAQQVLAVNRRLEQLHSVGQLDVDSAQAHVKEAEAEVTYMRASVSKCTVTAPYAGRVVKRMAAAHQFVTPGAQLLSIQDAGELEVRMIVPSRWLSRLRIGEAFQVQVDDLGKTYAARVLRTGARIDPVSQSVDIIGAIDGTPAMLLPGMSGWARFAAMTAATADATAAPAVTANAPNTLPQ